MLVSVIVPVHNVAPYIARCLRSIIAQTYTGEMECILVDDCGEDNSIEITRQFIEAYQGPIQFRIIAHEHNQGLSAARNTGINHAQGDYLYFLDSDDWLEPHCLASMVTLAERYPDVEMVQAGAVTHGGEAKPWLDLQKSALPEYMQGKESIKPLMLRRDMVPVTAWNRLVKREFLLRNNLYFKEGIIHEDELWTYHLAMKLNSLAILKQNVYHYDWHESGLMATGSALKYASLISIAKQMITDLDDCCQSQTVAYIADFIHLRSFNIHEESQRLAMLDCIPLLYPYLHFMNRQNARLWLLLAKLPIRRHYWLYSLLYHWKI